MDHVIKAFAQHITRKRTYNIVYENVVEIVYKDGHVVIFVDNAGPLHELEESQHDAQIKKAIDQIYGEESTYELKLIKSNKTHERANQAFRTGQKL